MRYQSEEDKRFMGEVRKIHGECLAYGCNNRVIGEWIGTTEQNVGRHWKDGGFSWKQIYMIKKRLEEIKETPA